MKSFVVFLIPKHIRFRSKSWRIWRRPKSTVLVAFHCRCATSSELSTSDQPQILYKFMPTSPCPECDPEETRPQQIWQYHAPYGVDHHRSSGRRQTLESALYEVVEVDWQNELYRRKS